MTTLSSGGPSLNSLKKAVLLSAAILTLASSDKIGNEISILGLSISGEGHNLFVALLMGTLGYYAGNYYLTLYTFFKLRYGPEFSDDETLVKIVSSTASEVTIAIHSFEDVFSDETQSSGLADTIANNLSDIKVRLDSIETNLGHLISVKQARFFIFEWVFPFVLICVGLLHGFGEFWQWCPTIFD